MTVAKFSNLMYAAYVENVTITSGFYRAALAIVKPSVRPSVKRVLCDKTKAPSEKSSPLILKLCGRSGVT